MHLPYKRPRLIEIHEQPWCPPTLRRPIQDMLTFMWTHRIRPFQSRAPYEAVADILEGIYDEIESEDKVLGDESESRLGIVDCCSGAGGPMPMVERAIKWVYAECGDRVVWHADLDDDVVRGGSSKVGCR